MTTRLPAAVLWDMDGTLVDTERYWMAAEEELVASFGGRWTHEDALGLVGMGLWESARIFQAAGVELDADTIVHRLTDRVKQQLEESGVPWRPGARELLESLRAASVPTALVTMSIRTMAEVVVEAIPFDAFDVLVTGDAVGHPKPHPEPYLAAADALGFGGMCVDDFADPLLDAIGIPHLDETLGLDDLARRAITRQ